LLREKKRGDAQQEKEREKNEYDPQKPFSHSSHGG
jgi:hypothetical protein